MNKQYLNCCSSLLRGYFGYLETIKGRSAQTVDGYFLDLRTFFRFYKISQGLLAEEAPEAVQNDLTDVDISLISNITLNDVYDFLNYTKNERDNQNTTRARKTTALRMFFRYLTDVTHQLDVNPIQNLSTPKIKKTLPKYLTLEQSLELLTKPSGPHAQRDYCMLVLLLNCGLRRAELVNIKLSDITSDQMLRIHGKGNKERMVHLNEACRNAIQQYLKVRPVDDVAAADKNYLFLSNHKKRLSLQGVHYIIKGYLKNIPGAEDYSTHKLRHTAATLMYQNGVDIRVLQEILGHENLGTTEIYTHISNAQIRQATESNPLSHVKPRTPPPSDDNAEKE